MDNHTEGLKSRLPGRSGLVSCEQGGPGRAQPQGSGGLQRGLSCWLALSACDCSVCPPSCRPCPHSSLIWVSRKEAPAHRPLGGLWLTFAALATARQQARPQTTSSRRPMASVCLQVALPPRHGYLWNRSQGQCVRTHGGTVPGWPSLQGRLLPRAWLAPTVHLCRSLPSWEPRQVAWWGLSGPGPGWVRGALRSCSFARMWCPFREGPSLLPSSAAAEGDQRGTAGQRRLCAAGHQHGWPWFAQEAFTEGPWAHSLARGRDQSRDRHGAPGAMRVSRWTGQRGGSSPAGRQP